MLDPGRKLIQIPLDNGTYAIVRNVETTPLSEGVILHLKRGGTIALRGARPEAGDIGVVITLKSKEKVAIKVIAHAYERLDEALEVAPDIGATLRRFY